MRRRVNWTTALHGILGQGVIIMCAAALVGPNFYGMRRYEMRGMREWGEEASMIGSIKGSVVEADELSRWTFHFLRRHLYHPPHRYHKHICSLILPHMKATYARHFSQPGPSPPTSHPKSSISSLFWFRCPRRRWRPTTDSD